MSEFTTEAMRRLHAHMIDEGKPILADCLLGLALQRDEMAADLARLTAELEKEKAQSRHLAEAMSRKIEELIATENQCSYYKAQYTRAEQIRKEACEANVKAQADMLWAKAELAASRERLERLRSLAADVCLASGYENARQAVIALNTALMRLNQADAALAAEKEGE